MLCPAGPAGLMPVTEELQSIDVTDGGFSCRMTSGHDGIPCGPVGVKKNLKHSHARWCRDKMDIRLVLGSGSCGTEVTLHTRSRLVQPQSRVPFALHRDNIVDWLQHNVWHRNMHGADPDKTKYDVTPPLQKGWGTIGRACGALYQ